MPRPAWKRGFILAGGRWLSTRRRRGSRPFLRHPEAGCYHVFLPVDQSPARESGTRNLLQAGTPSDERQAEVSGLPLLPLRSRHLPPARPLVPFLGEQLLRRAPERSPVRVPEPLYARLRLGSRRSASSRGGDRQPRLHSPRARLGLEAYLVTDRKLASEEFLLRLIRQASEAGVDRIQIREKDIGGRPLLRL